MTRDRGPCRAPVTAGRAQGDARPRTLQLHVSVTTVKTHLKSIHRKLDVPERREAVRRAREMELLAP